MILLIDRHYKKQNMKSLRESLKMVNESAPSDVKKAAKEAQKMLDDKKLRNDFKKKFNEKSVDDLFDWYKTRIDLIIDEWDDWYDTYDDEEPVEAFWGMISLDCNDTDGAGDFFYDDHDEYDPQDYEITDILRRLSDVWDSKK